jgi:hypothetical protein
MVRYDGDLTEEARDLIDEIPEREKSNRDWAYCNILKAMRKQAEATVYHPVMGHKTERLRDGAAVLNIRAVATLTEEVQWLSGAFERDEREVERERAYNLEGVRKVMEDRAIAYLEKKDLSVEQIATAVELFSHKWWNTAQVPVARWAYESGVA